MTQRRMPAGEYYIGDPCYVIEPWNEFCDVWFDQINGGIFEYDGLLVCVYNTQWGDGCYPASDGSMLPVDAGLIGAIPLALVVKGGEEDGTYVTFNEPFSCFRDQDGRLHFGRFNVMTGDEDDDEDY